MHEYRIQITESIMLFHSISKFRKHSEIIVILYTPQHGDSARNSFPFDVTTQFDYAYSYIFYILSLGRHYNRECVNSNRVVIRYACLCYIMRVCWDE